MTVKLTIAGTYRPVEERREPQEASLALKAVVTRAAATAQHQHEGWSERVRERFGFDFLLADTFQPWLATQLRTEEGDQPYFLESQGLLRRDQPLDLSALPLPREIEYYRFSPTAFELPQPLMVLPGAPGIPETLRVGEAQPGYLEVLVTELGCVEYPRLNLDGFWERLQTLLDTWRLSDWSGVRLPGAELGFQFNLPPFGTVTLSRSEAPDVVCSALALLESEDSLADGLQQLQGQDGWLPQDEHYLLQRLVSSQHLERLLSLADRHPVVGATGDQQPQLLLKRGGGEGWLREVLEAPGNHLFMASYIIEDVAMARAIAKQAWRRPGCVRVLCNLKETFRDALPRVLGEAGREEDLSPVDRLKLDCLRVLLESPLHLRHAETHLKAAWRDTASFLGSVNLTPNSLHVNWESGARFGPGEWHMELAEALEEAWEHPSAADVRWSSEREALILSQSPLLPARPKRRPQSILGPEDYRKTLTRDVQTAKQSLTAITYSLPGKSPLLHMGALGLSRWIVVESERALGGRQVGKLTRCHAKIVVIDRRTIYAGGINAPGPEPDDQPLHDLMVRMESPSIARFLENQIRCLGQR